MKTLILAGTALTTLAAGSSAAFAADKAAVLTNYSNIAEAKFQDSLATAQVLQTAVEALLAAPSVETLEAARGAWLDSRVPYQQSEVFRFGNAIVDDWEGKVNAWPLDEGLIDYVDASYGGPSDENALAVLNVVANPAFELSGKSIDASDITPALLEGSLHEAEGVESNVATGYHAIEFLLWGQDLNGTDHGAGNRAFTDYVTGDDCTNDNCDRRGAYLKAATDLLVSDLQWMAAQWAESGEARTNLLSDEDAGISAMLTGMGSLSYGETAGERMRLGLMLNDPEEEHDCFSDNTHNSHYYDGKGVQNVYLGEYTRVNGDVVSGASLSDLVMAVNADLDAEMRGKLTATMDALGALKAAADGGFSYDQMLAQGNAEGEALVMGGINGLVDQTQSIERVVTALKLDGIAFEGSDSLDNPTAVFQ
ncbi:imelysin family protein [Parasedimentitalea huanghaiensis]|uniref:Peptidase n=1 Tax=Parasedimentitalea huanghaiensis TaxID=2682100 RepID=A0A6L6WFE5_9RHOB|nr:imelysin family protein [Zongyanglinia huanghaiensis]MVO15659.1 peptidase [Zongyanglinia huanghaiensis]